MLGRRQRSTDHEHERLGMSDLLHEALHRAAASASPPDVNRLSLADEGSLSPPTSPSAHGAALAGSDDELIPVRTPAFTTPGGSQATSVASTPDVSRPGSPTNEHGGPSTPGRRPGASSRKSGKGKPRRDKTKEREKAERNRLTRDPLVKFPHEISSRIFAALGEHDLATCMAVCKRWRRSQTISACSIPRQLTAAVPRRHMGTDVMRTVQTTHGTSCFSRRLSYLSRHAERRTRQKASRHGRSERVRWTGRPSTARSRLASESASRCRREKRRKRRTCRCPTERSRNRHGRRRTSDCRRR